MSINKRLDPLPSQEGTTLKVKDPALTVSYVPYSLNSGRAIQNFPGTRGVEIIDLYGDFTQQDRTGDSKALEW